MLRAPGARRISPVRASHAARTAGEAGRFCAMDCRIDCRPASKPSASRRRETPLQFLRRPRQAKSFAARISASTGTKSSAAWPRSPKGGTTGTWLPRSQKAGAGFKPAPSSFNNCRFDLRILQRGSSAITLHQRVFFPGKYHEHGSSLVHEHVLSPDTITLVPRSSFDHSSLSCRAAVTAGFVLTIPAFFRLINRINSRKLVLRRRMP